MRFDQIRVIKKINMFCEGKFNTFFLEGWLIIFIDLIYAFWPIQSYQENQYVFWGKIQYIFSVTLVYRPKFFKFGKKYIKLHYNSVKKKRNFRLICSRYQNRYSISTNIYTVLKSSSHLRYNDAQKCVIFAFFVPKSQEYMDLKFVIFGKNTLKFTL